MERYRLDDDDEEEGESTVGGAMVFDFEGVFELPGLHADRALHGHLALCTLQAGPVSKIQGVPNGGKNPFSRVSSTAIRALILPSWRAPKFKRSQRGG